MKTLEKNKLVIVDPNHEGGHNNFCHSLAELLAARGDSVVYVNRQARSVDNVPYVHIAQGLPVGGRLSKLQEYFAIGIAVAKLSKDGYLIFWQSINLYLLLVIFFILIFGQKRTRWVLTLHNLVPHSNTKKERFEYWCVEKFAESSLVSKVVYHFDFFKEEEYRKSYYSESLRRKMFFVPHHSFLTDECQKITYRDKVRSVAGKKNINILIFGVIRENKGVVEFFELLNRSGFKSNNLSFTIAGRCAANIAASLAAQIKRLAGKVTFEVIDKYIDDDEKERLFLQADYILLPYLDSFMAQSGVVLDAYDYGIPLIVSRNLSLSYLLESDKTGFVYDSNNIVNVFQHEIFDAQQYAKFCSNIEWLCTNKYSSTSIHQVYTKIFN